MTCFVCYLRHRQCIIPPGAERCEYCSQQNLACKQRESRQGQRNDLIARSNGVSNGPTASRDSSPRRMDRAVNEVGSSGMLIADLGKKVVAVKIRWPEIKCIVCDGKEVTGALKPLEWTTCRDCNDSYHFKCLVYPPLEWQIQTKKRRCLTCNKKRAKAKVERMALAKENKEKTPAQNAVTKKTGRGKSGSTMTKNVGGIMGKLGHWGVQTNREKNAGAALQRIIANEHTGQRTSGEKRKLSTFQDCSEGEHNATDVDQNLSAHSENTSPKDGSKAANQSNVVFNCQFCKETFTFSSPKNAQQLFQSHINWCRKEKLEKKQKRTPESNAMQPSLTPNSGAGSQGETGTTNGCLGGMKNVGFVKNPAGSGSKVLKASARKQNKATDLHESGKDQLGSPSFRDKMRKQGMLLDDTVVKEVNRKQNSRHQRVWSASTSPDKVGNDHADECVDINGAVEACGQWLSSDEIQRHSSANADAGSSTLNDMAALGLKKNPEGSDSKGHKKSGKNQTKISEMNAHPKNIKQGGEIVASPNSKGGRCDEQSKSKGKAENTSAQKENPRAERGRREAQTQQNLAGKGVCSGSNTPVGAKESLTGATAQCELAQQDNNVSGPSTKSTPVAIKQEDADDTDDDMAPCYFRIVILGKDTPTMIWPARRKNLTFKDLRTEIEEVIDDLPFQSFRFTDGEGERLMMIGKRQEQKLGVFERDLQLTSKGDGSRLKPYRVYIQEAK